MSSDAKMCAHCGEPIGSTVYHQCGECGEPVCGACAADPCCRQTAEHEPKSADPAEG